MFRDFPQNPTHEKEKGKGRPREGHGGDTDIEP
jgi:hypothetical protein